MNVMRSIRVNPVLTAAMKTTSRHVSTASSSQQPAGKFARRGLHKLTSCRKKMQSEARWIGCLIMQQVCK